MKSALIIEDDIEIVGLLEIHLKDLGFKVSNIQDGVEGLHMAIETKPDLIILDITLPSMDGIDICKSLRAQKSTSFILMLTARSEELDKVLGLEMGADDYLTKPFSIREFIARVKALFRREKSQLIENNEEIKNTKQKFDVLTIDSELRKVMLHGKKVDLSPKEYELLGLMASNPGKSYSRIQLLNLIWGYEFEGYEHTVNTHINRLRAKIEPDMGNPKFILTTWGVGYRFNEEI
ncbi:MAG: response regulator transcription factor [Maribacter sp.]